MSGDITPSPSPRTMHSKRLAIAGCAMLLFGVFTMGALDVWLALHNDWTAPVADRPWPITLRRITVYVGSGLWWLRQWLHAPILVGILLALWGGWPTDRKDERHQ
ncbi:MAG: hypothetical protein KGM49_10920 [Sphingomonadales bacterium]|nr:hypothetical protein [Sphingomonadales bacterium]